MGKIKRAKRKPFVEDWARVKGMSITALTKKSRLSTRTMARILAGESFHSTSLEKIVMALGIEREEIWVDPYDRMQEQLTPQPQTGPRPTKIVDLGQMLDDPRTMWDGQILSEEERSFIRGVLERLIVKSK